MSNDRLVRALEDILDPDLHKRSEAARMIVEAGAEATPALVEFLREGPHVARWQAARLLGEIADPKAAPDLVRALEDEEDDVRWLAAEALVRLGREALPALFDALIDPEKPITPWLRQGAHHVLRGIRSRDRDETLRACIDRVIQELERHDDGNLPVVIHQARLQLHL